MFDIDGNLILPENIFANVVLHKFRNIECPNCGHLIKSQTTKRFTVCLKCHIEVEIQ